MVALLGKIASLAQGVSYYEKDGNIPGPDVTLSAPNMASGECCSRFVIPVAMTIPPR